MSSIFIDPASCTRGMSGRSETRAELNWILYPPRRSQRLLVFDVPSMAVGNTSSLQNRRELGQGRQADIRPGPPYRCLYVINARICSFATVLMPLRVRQACADIGGCLTYHKTRTQKCQRIQVTGSQPLLLPRPSRSSPFHRSRRSTAPALPLQTISRIPPLQGTDF